MTMGSTLRRHSVGYLLSGAVALGLVDRDIGEDLAAGLIHAAADPGPESLLLRANLRRERLFEPPPQVIPEWLQEIDRFVESNCFAGVMKAVLESRAMGEEPVETPTLQASRRSPPSPVCAGNQLTLHGSGVGATPPRWRGGVRAHDRTAPPRDDLKVKVEWPASPSATEIVRWRASADGCFASLGYSNDGGETWTPLALPGPGDTIQVDAGALPGGRECALELIVTDGFQTRRIRSDAYEVEPKGWVLQILSPAAGAKLPPGQPVLLAAQGYHLEKERRAGFDGIEWECSAGGGLGMGARVLATLEPGEHTITGGMFGVRLRWSCPSADGVRAPSLGAPAIRMTVSSAWPRCWRPARRPQPCARIAPCVGHAFVASEAHPLPRTTLPRRVNDAQAMTKRIGPPLLQ